jgi:squalene synthase HpnC
MTTRSLSYTRLAPLPASGPRLPDRVAPPHIPDEAEILGRARTENFRVASRLLPRGTRQHLMAFYGFARLVDQLGDAYAGDRLAALDWIEAETVLALADPGSEGLHPLVARAAASVRVLQGDPATLIDLPACLTDLIAANRQDQSVRAYATVDELMGYCQLSADPVGRFVLAAFAVSTPERQRWSDAICTGLQLAEHWQDIAEDARAGRIYLPADDLGRFGVSGQELAGPPPASRALQALVAFEVARARRLLEDGAPLVTSLRGRARWAVAGFWAGGAAALDAVAAQGFDPLRGSPRPAPARVARHLGAVLRGCSPRREAA